MSETKHTPGCILSKCIIDDESFAPGCPLCQLHKTAPKLLDVCRSLVALIEMIPRNVTNDLMLDSRLYLADYLKVAKAAIAEAEKQG
jgi:hypothetical protein